ncbi:MAG: glycosyltransferase [Clostridiales bacterium]|nr:glycosyltransferase [Clostridiales bacterium]
MRVLIISVTAGYGHYATAKALEDELTSRGNEVVVEDLLKYASPLLFEIVDHGYLFYTSRLPRNYRYTYASFENHAALRKVASAIARNIYGKNKYQRYFAGYMPDVILCTHPFPAIVLNDLKKRKKLDIPVIGIVTDYCIQPFWEELVHIENIIIASRLLSYAAIKKGIAEQKLLPLGIPVQPKYLHNQSQAEAREALGLDPDKLTLLMMSGSMGYGNMAFLVRQILDLGFAMQIVCICGTNELLYQKLADFQNVGNVHIHRFVDNVNTFMDAADCLVTKAGGLTVTEALAKSLPMILVNPIPGHEERNVEFLVNNGAAVKVSKTFSVAESIFYLFSNPQRLTNMKEAIRLIACPTATKDICDYVENLSAH